MFLRAIDRKKDGKIHTYWSVVENRRVARGRVIQRHVLYLGEINSSQERAWRKSIEVLDEGARGLRSLSLFPEDRCDEVLGDDAIVRLRLSQLQLCRPRQWGACWLALTLWEELELDTFWAERLPPSRKRNPGAGSGFGLARVSLPTISTRLAKGLRITAKRWARPLSCRPSKRRGNGT